VRDHVLHPYKTTGRIIVSSLFYDALSVTRLYSVDDRVKSEWWWIGKDLVGSFRGLVLRYYHGIHWREWGKSWKTSIRIAGHRSRDLKSGPPEYYAGVLTIQTQCLVGRISIL
jgi:hypothetical protein